jgi:DNA-binding transcriptional MocR family regulator
MTCSESKRKAIVELARHHGFLIVEDAPYRQLRYRGTEAPTLFSLAPERSVLMSSFTKLIAPGVRTGFIFGDASLIARLAKVAEDTYICPSYVAQGITFEWCRRGLLEPQIARLKALYEPRLDACLRGLDRYLPEAAHTRPDGGFFVSLTLPHGADVTGVRAEAARHNLMLTDGRSFFPSGGGDHFLRLPFCALTPAEIDEGLRRLAASVKVTDPKAQV